MRGLQGSSLCLPPLLSPWGAQCLSLYPSVAAGLPPARPPLIPPHVRAGAACVRRVSAEVEGQYLQKEVAGSHDNVGERRYIRREAEPGKKD